MLHNKAEEKLENCIEKNRKEVGDKPRNAAYGYSQALDGTWKEYKESTGNRYHRRSNFAHSTNFIGWYADKTKRLLGISKNNAYLQYLAYHQGQAGFKTGAYKNKKGLLKVANKTAFNKKKFDRQLKKCM